MSNLEFHNELEQLAPKLSKLKKRDTFEAPEGYLDAFDEKLLARIEIEELNKKTALVPTFSFWKKGLWVAAASVLLIGAFWYFQNPGQTDTNQMLAYQMDDEEIESYVLENITDFESENISVYLEEPSSLDTIWYNAADALLEEYDTEDFEDFL